MSAWRDSTKSLIKDIISRKFVVFVAATVLFWVGNLSQESWLYVALGYMSANILESTTNLIFRKGEN